MNAPLDPRPWPGRRWAVLVLLVFTAHVGFIFAFGDRKPLRPQPPAPGVTLGLASAVDELIALRDPTLFALPHRRSSAAAVWLNAPEKPFQPYRWAAPPRFLALSLDRFGESFQQLMQSNAILPPVLPPRSAPEPTPLRPLEENVLARSRSFARLSPELASRRWLNPPELPAWPAADLLTNTVVQVAVRADGQVFSAKVLPPGSQSAAADEFALKTAQAARFNSTPAPRDTLTIGALIFEWATTPLPTTEPPASAP